jgi:hypothetical protein
VTNDQSQAPGYTQGWRWEDPRWRDWTSNDPAKLVLEALRRAVDIRDQIDKSRLQARDVMLVDVLNELCAALQVDGSDLWDLPGA